MADVKKVKVTKAQRFTDIKHLLNGETVENGTTLEEALATLDHELELLASKNNGNRKPTATQLENEKLRPFIVEYLRCQPNGATCSEMIKNIEGFRDYSTSKVSSLCKQLVDSKVVERTTGEKGKTLFKLK